MSAKSGEDHEKIKDILVALEEFNVLSKWLQDKTGKLNGRIFPVNLYNVRVIFDDIITRFPSMAKHLKQDAGIVHRPAFEMGIAKLQGNTLHSKLTASEKRPYLFSFPMLLLLLLLIRTVTKKLVSL